MNKEAVCVAFYHYKEPVHDLRSLKRRFVHEITCLLTRSKFSHCELVQSTVKPRRGGNYFVCDSASGRDGGVRRKYINLFASRWTLITVQANTHFAQSVFERHRGEKYDYLGALRAVLPFFKQSPKRWYCSEYVAAALNLPADAGKTPQTLYDYLRSNK